MGRPDVAIDLPRHTITKGRTHHHLLWKNVVAWSPIPQSSLEWDLLPRTWQKHPSPLPYSKSTPMCKTTTLLQSNKPWQNWCYKIQWTASPFFSLSICPALLTTWLCAKVRWMGEIEGKAPRTEAGAPLISFPGWPEWKLCPWKLCLAHQEWFYLPPAQPAFFLLSGLPALPMLPSLVQGR